MLQGGQGLLLHLQGCLVPFSQSQKLLRIHRSEIHSGGVENIGLQRMQTPPRLLYLQKRQQPCITMVSSSLLGGSLGKFWGNSHLRSRLATRLLSGVRGPSGGQRHAANTASASTGLPVRHLFQLHSPAWDIRPSGLRFGWRRYGDLPSATERGDV